MIQINLERVFRNKYYDDILKITDILSDEYDKLEELANNEKDYCNDSTFCYDTKSRGIRKWL